MRRKISKADHKRKKKDSKLLKRNQNVIYIRMRQLNGLRVIFTGGMKWG